MYLLAPIAKKILSEDLDYDFTEKIVIISVEEVLNEFINRSKSQKRQKWSVIPAIKLKRVWTDFSKNGFVRDESALDDIVQSLIRNVGRLYANTYLAGHTPSDPDDDFANFGITTDEQKEAFYDFIEDDHGQPRISDYGLDPLIDLAHKAFKETDSGKKLVYATKMLDIVHWRSNLPAMFVQGGKKVLDDLAGYEKEVPANNLSEIVSKNAAGVFWHGSPSGDLKGGPNGLHVGTYQAAKEALEARIGIPEKGDWDGTREYGKTLLAGRKAIEAGKYGKHRFTGININAPDDAYYPTGEATYGDRSKIPLTVKPDLFPVKIVGRMSNTPYNPHEDFKANGYMSAQLKKGRAKSGYYYENVGEDAGSISAVVPNGTFLQRLK